MAAFPCYREAMLFLNRIARTSSTAKICAIAHRNLSPFSLKYCTSTSDSLSFRVNYLVNNLGFSIEIASEVSKRVLFEKSEKPDSVLTLFRNYGFSNVQISSIIKIRPSLLMADPHRNILPKLEFLQSKGASRSELVHIVTSSPRFLLRSLENCIIPSYDFLKRFLQSDERTIEYIKRRASLISENRVADNVAFLLVNGVPESKAAILLFRKPLSLNLDSESLKKAVEDIKKMGFNPSTTAFVIALHTKIVVTKSAWKRKIDLYKKWGWSEEATVAVFVRRPWCMEVSERKIGEIMKFFVTHLGWESLEVAKYPKLLSLSLQKTILPRTLVMQSLRSKGSIKKNVRYVHAFLMPEKLFLQRFVNRFEEEAPQLLKLYEEKMNISKFRLDVIEMVEEERNSFIPPVYAIDGGESNFGCFERGQHSLRKQLIMEMGNDGSRITSINWEVMDFCGQPLGLAVYGPGHHQTSNTFRTEFEEKNFLQEFISHQPGKLFLLNLVYCFSGVSSPVIKP